MTTETNTSATPDGPATDIRDQNLLIRLAPNRVRPYLLLLRLDRPIGAWLLLLPCWWGVALASPGVPDWRLLLVFFVGAFTMRGAGCAYNDIIDHDIDAKVARTALRPIPSGQITANQAFVFFIIVCLLGLLVLLQLNTFAIWVGFASLIPVAIYPFMKRVLDFPQLFMGLAFNWGALVGWAAVTGELAGPAVLLYLGGVMWAVGYDTIYGHMDKKDDELVGVKSLALKLGDNTRPWIGVFYALAIIMLVGAGYVANTGWAFYPLMLAGAGHMTWQVARVDFDNPADCLAKFRMNRDFGLVVFAATVAGQLSS